MQKQIPKLTPQQMTVFMAIIHLIASPTLGLMLAKKKINALEFATTFMAMSATSSKIWGGNREEEKSLIEESTKHADIMLRYLSLFASEKALEIKSHTSQSPLKVFLCHSSGDKPEVKRLHQRLAREEWIKPWLDEIELLPGVEWDSEIKKQVKNSDVVIVCLSTASITKEGYVQKEIRYALDIADEKPEGTIFIIPLRLEKCDVPSRLNKLHWVDYFIKDGYGKLLNSLEARAIGLRHKTIPKGKS